VLLIARANPVKNLVAAKHVFLAEHLFGVLMAAICSENLTLEGFAGVLSIAARN
jgi:hypothetical protein